MININKLASKLEQILNGTYSEIVLPDGRPDYYFKVKTFGTLLDSISDKDYKLNYIPVILSVSNGENEPIYNSGLADEDFNIAIFFPLHLKDDMTSMGIWINSILSGNYLSFGDETTSKVALNTSKPVINQIESQSFNQFANTMQYFKLEVKKTDIYCVMEIDLFTSYGKTGIEFGNSITYELEIQESSTSLPIKSKLLRVDSSSGLDSSTNTQQIINEYFSKGVYGASAKAQSVEFIFDSSPVCICLLDNIENGTIANLYSVKLYKTYNMQEFTKTYTFDVLPTTCMKNEQIGIPITFVIGFIPKAEIDGE